MVIIWGKDLEKASNIAAQRCLTPFYLPSLHQAVIKPLNARGEHQVWGFLPCVGQGKWHFCSSKAFPLSSTAWPVQQGMGRGAGPAASTEQCAPQKVPTGPGEDRAKNGAIKAGNAKPTELSTFSLWINVMVPSRDGHPSSACRSYTLRVCGQQPSAAPLHGFTKAVPPQRSRRGWAGTFPSFPMGHSSGGRWTLAKVSFLSPFLPQGCQD